MGEAALILTLGKHSENQRLLADALRAEGYSVEIADEPATLQSLLAETDNPALVLIDIDGYDATIWDIATCCDDEDIPTLIVASADAGRVRDEGSEYGIDAVLSKPINSRTLSSRCCNS